MSLHRAKHAAEQALRASGLAWTIVRPAPFLETWTGIIGAKIAGNGQALVFGPGTTRSASSRPTTSPRSSTSPSATRPSAARSSRSPAPSG